MTTQTTTPTWFSRVLAAPVDTGSVEVEGARVHYRAWGPVGAPGVVLVHGGSAHSGWWDHLGPLLATGRRVVALDLTGHGWSDRRERYAASLWAREAVTVADAAGAVGPPVLVGHSMGGMVAFTAAHQLPDQVDGVVLVDSPLRMWTPEEQAAHTGRAFTTRRRYATHEDGAERFRLVPPQDFAWAYIVDHVAHTSLREEDGAWVWHFDPKVYERDHSLVVPFAAPPGRLAYLRCEHGVIDEAAFAELRTRLGPGAVVVELPQAGHHPMFDQPFELVTALRTVLATWAARG